MSGRFKEHPYLLLLLVLVLGLMAFSPLSAGADSHRILQDGGMICEDCHNVHGGTWLPECDDCHVTGSHSEIMKDPNGTPIVNANGNYILQLEPYDENGTLRDVQLKEVPVVMEWAADPQYKVNDPHLSAGLSCVACHSIHAWIEHPDCSACHVSGSHSDPVYTEIEKDASGQPKLVNGNYSLKVYNPSTWGYDYYEVPRPDEKHSAFPSFHFNSIDCRTCHIPSINAANATILSDYSTISSDYNGTTYTGARVQRISKTGLKPLHIWKTRESSSMAKITPAVVRLVAFWRDGNATIDTGLVHSATTASGLPDNSTISQGGDMSLIANTETEISAMVGELQALGALAPVMSIRSDYYVPSHMVAPVGSGSILGAEAGGGCLMCHSSSDQNDINYTESSVGFFDGIYTLYQPPLDGGNGLVQYDDGTKHVELEVCGSLLSNIPNGSKITNSIDANICLGFTPTQLAGLKSPGIGGVQRPSAWFSWYQEETQGLVSTVVHFDARATVCPTGLCIYKWDFDGDGTYDDNTSGVLVDHDYGAPGSFEVTLMVLDTSLGTRDAYSDNVTVRAGNTPPVASFTIQQVPSGNATITFTDNSTDLESDQSALVGTINWGDGLQTQINGGDSVQHTYGAIGVYKVRYFVTDGEFQSKAQDVRVVVNQ